jgi:hypothetical protein
VPLNQWVRYEITAGLGKASTRNWALKVTLTGQSPREWKNLPLASDKFEELTWIGYTSNANTNTSFYLDNFAVEAKGK